MADGIAAVGLVGIPNHLTDLPELNKMSLLLGAIVLIGMKYEL